MQGHWAFSSHVCGKKEPSYVLCTDAQIEAHM